VAARLLFDLIALFVQSQLVGVIESAISLLNEPLSGRHKPNCLKIDGSIDAAKHSIENKDTIPLHHLLR